LKLWIKNCWLKILPLIRKFCKRYYPGSRVVQPSLKKYCWNYLIFLVEAASVKKTVSCLIESGIIIRQIRKALSIRSQQKKQHICCGALKKMVLLLTGCKKYICSSHITTAEEKN